MVIEAGSILGPSRLGATEEPGPGAFQRVPEEDSMPAPAAEYQAKYALPKGWAYVVNRVKLDDFRDGVLIDTKGQGYAWAVDKVTGRFRTDIDYRGALGFIEQAVRQVNAAPQGTPIVWYFAEAKAAQATRYLFADNGIQGINVIYRP